MWHVVLAASLLVGASSAFPAIPVAQEAGAPAAAVIFQDATNASFGVDSSPVAVSNGSFVIAGATGVVRRFDLAPGGLEATIRWTVQPEPTLPLGQAAFAVSDGVVIFTAGDRLLALRAASGATAWAVPLDAFAQAEPLVIGVPGSANGSAMAVVGTYGGWVGAFHTGTGQALWRAEVGAPVARAAPVAAEVAAAAGGARVPGVVVVTMAGTAVGLDAATGAVAWRWSKPDGGFAGGFGASPTALGAPASLVLLPSVDGSVYAVDAAGPPANGSAAWAFDSGFAIDARVTQASAGVLVVCSDSQRVAGVSPDGAPLWSLSTGDWVQAAAAADGAGSVWAASNDGLLYRLNATSGAVTAQVDVWGGGSLVAGAPRAVPPGSGPRRVEVLSASEGAGLVEAPLRSPLGQGPVLDARPHLSASPVVVGGATLIAASTSGAVIAVAVAPAGRQ